MRVRLFLLFSLFIALTYFLNLTTTTPIVRGKSPALPLTSELTPEQLLAQNLALSDPRVQQYTVGQRSEVFGVRRVGRHVPDTSQICYELDCRQVEIFG